MVDENKALWEKSAEFHGHVCPGLTIGYRAALYAIDLLELKLGGGGNAGCLSKDEEVVCISENDACGCDAIQVIMGCSIGKGNLLFHMTGKQAFSFYNRKTGKSVRVVLNKPIEEMTREQTFDYYHACKQEDMFTVKKTTIDLPEHARIFESYKCECCGETAGANWIRLSGGKKLCVDCYTKYDRFDV